MVVLVLLRGGAVVLLGTDVELASQDGLDAFGLGCFEEVHGTIDVAVVGDGHGFLPDVADVGYQFFYVTGAIEEGVVSVQMQVGKFSHGDSFSLVRRAGLGGPADVQKWCRLRKSGSGIATE